MREHLQKADVAAVLERLSTPGGRALLARPTGYGKTHVAAQVARIWWEDHHQTSRLLVANGRRGLREQLISRLDGIEVVSPFRHAREKGDYGLLIVDEAHGGVTRRLLETLRSETRPMLGLTATPFRSKGVGDSVYERLVEVFGPRVTPDVQTCDLMTWGLLKTVDAGEYRNSAVFCRIHGIDYSAVETETEGSFRRLESQVHAARQYAEHYNALTRGKTGIIYCWTRETAREVSARIPGSRTWLGGDHTSVAELFSQGVHCVVTCLKAVEGVDIPAVDAIMLARPFKSLRLVVQALGRGLRLSAGSLSLLVLDCFAALGRHGSNVLAPFGEAQHPITLRYVYPDPAGMFSESPASPEDSLPAPATTPETKALAIVGWWGANDGKDPSKHSNDPEERALGMFLNNCKQGRNPTIHHILDEAKPGWKGKRDMRPPETSARALVKWWGANDGKNPSRRSNDPEERVLGTFLQSCRQGSNPTIHHILDEAKPGWNDKRTRRPPETSAKALVGWWKANDGKNPSKRSNDPEERALGDFLQRCKQGCNPTIHHILDEAKPGWNTRNSRNPR